MAKCEVKDLLLLKSLIAHRGLSLRQFARNIGVSDSYLSQIATGNKAPSQVVAKKISDGLEVDITDIFLIKLLDNQANGSD